MAWAHVQTIAFTNDAGGASLTFAGTFTAGNLLVVDYTYGSVSASPSVTDNGGTPNTYTDSSHGQLSDTGNGQSLGLHYAQNIQGGAYTVTVSLGLTASFRRGTCTEYSGLLTASAKDASAATATPATAGSGTDNAVCGAVTSTAANDCIVVAGMDTSTSPTTLNAGTGYTARDGLAASTGYIKQDMNLAAITTETPEFTVDNGVSFLAITIAFKEVAATGAVTPSVNDAVTLAESVDLRMHLSNAAVNESVTVAESLTMHMPIGIRMEKLS